MDEPDDERTSQLKSQLEMARVRLFRVREFTDSLPPKQRDDLRLILGPEFDQVPTHFQSQ